MKKCLKNLKFEASKYNILVINDYSMNKMIYNIFSNYGFNTFISYTPQESKEQINSNKIDYIIIDINLSVGIGYDLIKELSSSHSQSKFIVLTSETDSQIKEYIYQKNVIDFINKDQNFLYKISEMPNIIKQIEKNKSKTILLVDEFCQDKKELKTILKSRNYNVLEAKNIEESLEIININKIDLIFINLGVEKSAVYDFLIKNRVLILDRFNIKIIIVTEDITLTLLRDFFSLGVKEIIRKPYIVEELIIKTEVFIKDKDIEDEVTFKTKLLNQYKDTVDRSAVVSKTDARGIITYANKAFCDISGYTEKELLGKSHNIVRHKDIDSKVFKEMWHTIKDLKSPWKGIVKNRKKSGGAYWVQTIINPIVDNNGEIVEYIGIRTDITDIEETKEYLKNQYDISQNNFQEVMNLSKLYENAIEQSNIILKFDKSRNITYVDKKFYEISAYSKEDLIGKPYDYINKIYPFDNLQLEKMWEKLSKGMIWKGQISSIFKNNRVHYFSATVVPIVNLNGETLEYMSIKKDITDVIELYKEIEETQKEIIYKIGEIGESRSKETGNHVKRVANYSKLLAILYGLSERECDILFTASPMHDIGKVAIPDAILNKTTKLDENEWKIMRSHTDIGYDILKNSKREILQAAAIIARDHHEKWDGSGYPRGIKEEEIHIYGRITAVADVFDALGSDRCYKKAWSDEDIIILFEKEKCKQFDPKLVDIFLGNIDKFKEIRNIYKD